jgi:hypothetical protein
MTHHNAARQPARPMLVAAALAAALAVIALASPHPAVGASDRPTVRPTLAPDSKVGQIKRTRAYIALSFDGRRLRAYVCNGKGRRRATISTWFSGRWDGHSPITLAADGLALRIDEVHPDGHVTGRLRLRRGTRRFAVEPATGPAGLLRRDGPPRAAQAARDLDRVRQPQRPRRHGLHAADQAALLLRHVDARRRNHRDREGVQGPDLLREPPHSTRTADRGLCGGQRRAGTRDPGADISLAIPSAPSSSTSAATSEPGPSRPPARLGASRRPGSGNAHSRTYHQSCDPDSRTPLTCRSASQRSAARHACCGRPGRALASTELTLAIAEQSERHSACAMGSSWSSKASVSVR